MADIPAILTSISTAIEIAKALRQAEGAIEKAELRLKLAEVVIGLADAKLAIADLRDENYTKGQVIADLRIALESKGQYSRKGDAYYRADENGQPHGEPHCLRCWEHEHRGRQLVVKTGSRGFKICPTCKSEVYEHRSETIT